MSESLFEANVKLDNYRLDLQTMEEIIRQQKSDFKHMVAEKQEGLKKANTEARPL